MSMGASMSSSQRFRVIISDLATQAAIGIHPLERTPQRILVNAVIEGMYPSRPQTVADCFNYEFVHRIVTEEWPELPHTDLLETRVFELLKAIFTVDMRVDFARVSVGKPDIFANAKCVSVEAEWTRADFTGIVSN